MHFKAAYASGIRENDVLVSIDDESLQGYPLEKVSAKLGTLYRARIVVFRPSEVEVVES